MKPFRRIKKTAILVYDGEHWHGGIFARRHGGWESADTLSVPAHSLKQIPAELLDWLQSRAAGASARILVPGDIRAMQMEMPEDFEMDELHTALSYELSGETGTDAHFHRLAAASALHCGFGGDAHSYLVAGFDLRQMEQYGQQLSLSGLRFEAIGALELGVLAACMQGKHEDIAQHAAKDRIPWAFPKTAGTTARQSPPPLLLLRSRTGFLAIPGDGERPQLVTAVQIGLQPGPSEQETERMARLQRRLQTVPDAHTHVVVPLEEGHVPEERIRAIFHAESGDALPFQVTTLRTLLPRMMAVALKATPGSCHAACPLIGLSPQPPDPHRSGSLIGGMILLLVALHILSRWWSMASEMRSLDQHNAKAQALAAARQSARAEVESLRQQRLQIRERYEALRQQGSPLPEGFILTLDTLATSIPPYTRIVRLRQDAGSSQFELEGAARWAEGKNRLARSLMDSLRPRQFVVEPGKVEMQSDGREQRFSFMIHPLDDRRTP